MISIIDYGVGNLFSLSSSLKKIGVESVVTSNINTIERADALILPGVGAFGDAAKKLRSSGLYDVIKSIAADGRPLLGICLGMQMLFEISYEYGINDGLGLIPGEVRPLSDYISGFKIPHMGWNSLKIVQKDCPILKYTSNDDYVYFVHSFCGICSDNKNLVATTEYGIDVTAVVSNGNIFGTQFHPEKSGEVGLKILKAFALLAESK